MNLESRKKYPNKKFLKSAKFEAKEQFTQSALDNLTKEKWSTHKKFKKSWRNKWKIRLRVISTSLYLFEIINLNKFYFNY